MRQGATSEHELRLHVVGATIFVVGAMLACTSCGSDDDSDQAGGTNTTTAPTVAGAAETTSTEPAGTSPAGAAAPVTSDPAVVAAALQAAGQGCDDYENLAEPAELADASGECTIAGGSEATIDGFQSPEALDAFVAYGQDAGCAFFAGNTVPYVVGEHWTISITVDLAELETGIPSEPTEDLAAAIGAEVGTLDC